MLKFYYSAAPNPTKIALFLEETGLPYEAIPVDTRKGDQHKPEYLAINPNAKVPAIVDGDAVVFDSSAILLYLAEKTGQLWPQDFPTKWRVVEWLMWQMGGPGPFLGQVHHFVKFNPGKSAYAEERYTKEAKRIWSVLDRRLGEGAYVAGDYSIADIAIWPWISRFQWQTVNFADYPNVKRWYLAIADRPAVQRGWNVPPRAGGIPMP
jgi:GST-like protein